MSKEEDSIDEILEILNCKLDILIESFEQLLNGFKEKNSTKEIEG